MHDLAVAADASSDGVSWIGALSCRERVASHMVFEDGVVIVVVVVAAAAAADEPSSCLCVCVCGMYIMPCSAWTRADTSSRACVTRG